GALVGGCEIRTGASRVAEISYWTFPQHRRKGFATHAVRLLCDFAFRELGVERIEAQVEPNNRGSRGVIEGAGFLEERTLPKADRTISGELRDMILYSLTPGR
ncbi:MAG: GNAT family N-acetyltransferase, partial [Actinomycetota bacterium]|nr:GNAT family N-acetyltransferase [Actinomycetota bacterium]